MLISDIPGTRDNEFLGWVNYYEKFLDMTYLSEESKKLLEKIHKNVSRKIIHFHNQFGKASNQRNNIANLGAA